MAERPAYLRLVVDNSRLRPVRIIAERGRGRSREFLEEALTRLEMSVKRREAGL